MGLSHKSANNNLNNTFMFDHPVVLEQTPRWVRVKIGNDIVADSKQALVLLEYGPGRLPTYFFPRKDIRTDLLDTISTKEQSDETVTYWAIESESQSVEKIAWSFMNPPENLAALKGYLTFKWGEPVHWFEEDEEVFIHAKDPYKRIDVVPSSRHVCVVIADETVADTRAPYLLFETSLPTRYYINKDDIKMEYLHPTDHFSFCPYKGRASYWSVKVGNSIYENIVWSYPEPVPECPKLKNLFCFFNEKVDIYLDDELQSRPITPFS